MRFIDDDELVETLQTGRSNPGAQRVNSRLAPGSECGLFSGPQIEISCQMFP